MEPNEPCAANGPGGPPRQDRYRFARAGPPVCLVPGGPGRRAERPRSPSLERSLHAQRIFARGTPRPVREPTPPGLAGADRPAAGGRVGGAGGPGRVRPRDRRDHRPEQLRGVAVGDFNGDGKPDLAVANVGKADLTGFSGNNVTILAGNGTGTFAAVQVIQPSPFFLPTALVAVELNGDGKPDLAVTNINVTYLGETSGSVSVFLSKGDGEFNTGPVADTGGKGVIALTAGDINHDCKTDLV
ncbi:MAG TPA: VCBS repeat-containing protein, partial [Gemmataceae bacterium]